MFLGAMCWCRDNIYMTKKCVLFQILHQTRAHITIQCHDNNIWKHMCIKTLYYSTETFIWSNVQRKETGWKYIWALYHELVLFLQSRIFLLCTREWDRGGHLGLELITSNKKNENIIKRVRLLIWIFNTRLCAPWFLCSDEIYNLLLVYL